MKTTDSTQTTTAQATELPPEVHAALARGDKVEAMRLLRERLARGDSPALAAVAAALATGDAGAAGRLLKEAVKRAIGAPPAESEAQQAISAGAIAGDGLAPGQVPQRKWVGTAFWVVAAVVCAVLVYLRFAG